MCHYKNNEAMMDAKIMRQTPFLNVKAPYVYLLGAEASSWEAYFASTPHLKVTLVMAIFSDS
jgi:hypothetical protein